MAYKPKSHQVPRWSINSSSYEPMPVEISKWEQFLAAEQLEEKDALKKNPKVMDFATKYHQKFFVPTKILKLYGLDFNDA